MFVGVLKCLNQTKCLIHWSTHRKVIQSNLSQDSFVIDNEETSVKHKNGRGKAISPNLRQILVNVNPCTIRTEALLYWTNNTLPTWLVCTHVHTLNTHTYLLYNLGLSLLNCSFKVFFLSMKCLEGHAPSVSRGHIICVCGVTVDIFAFSQLPWACSKGFAKRCSLCMIIFISTRFGILLHLKWNDQTT